MLFMKVFLFCATLVSAAELFDRAASTTAQILADVKTVDQDINTLTSDIKAWDCTLSGAVKIQNDEQKLEAAVNQTITDVKQQAAITSADCNTILNALNTLEADLQKLLQALVAAKDCFKRVGLIEQVRNYIRQLKNEFDNLITLLQKLCGSASPKYQTLQSKVDSDFNQALQALA